MNNCETTDFLYAQPSFLEGMGRILDFGNTMTEYNTSETGELADHIAIHLDYGVVEAALRKALHDAHHSRHLAKG